MVFGMLKWNESYFIVSLTLVLHPINLSSSQIIKWNVIKERKIKVTIKPHKMI